jgi:flagellar hook-length control protein FliK
VSSVVSEAGAVRHAHLGQGPRSNSPSAEPADQTSPFASLLDAKSDTPPTAAAPPPAAPPLPSQKPALRPQDGRALESSPDTAAAPQKSPSDSPAPATQAGAVPPPTAKSSQGTDGAQAVPPLDALVKAAAADTKSTINPNPNPNPNANANVDATATSSAADATAGSTPVDPAAAGSTAAAVTDIHGDKTAKPDSSASDIAQLTVPPADLSASRTIPVAPQPVAVASAAPVIPAPAAASGSGSGSDSGTGQDAARIAALGDAVKAGSSSGTAGAPSGTAGAPSGKATGAEAAKSGSAPADSGAGASPPADLGGSAKPPDPKIADAAKPVPAPAPTPPLGQKDLNPASGQGQPNAADGLQSRNGDAVAAAQAVIDHAHQGAVASQPAEGTAAPQPASSNSSNDTSSIAPNADPKRDPAAPAIRIEDITRQALDAAVRHSEAPAADAGSGGASRADSVPSAGTQQSPDGGLVAPAALTTSAAPTAAPATNVTPATIPIAGLAVEIAAHARAGKNRFEIRLDPPELGRIDVRLDVDRDGKVTSRVVVERPQTLDMLLRDAPELERSLQQAGLKTADNALQFSLRDQGGFGSQNPYPNSGSPAGAARLVIPDRDMPSVDAATAGYGRAIGASTGLDIRV